MANKASYGVDHAHEAPEVASCTTPMLVQEHNHEKMPAQEIQSLGIVSQPQGAYFSPAPAYTVHEVPKSLGRNQWIRAAIVGIAALLIGLGVGIGIGFGVNGNKSSSGNACTSSPTASNASATSTSFPSTSTGVISGTTGIANYSCTNGYIYPTKNNPTAFTEDCNSDYADNWAGWNHTDANPTIVHNLKFLTSYSFEDCMEQCAIYNKHVQPGNATCQAVTYNANLTFSIATDDGSCFLKNMRGANISQFTNQNYHLIASAYIAADL